MVWSHLVQRRLLLVIGWISVGLGVIGILLPVMPTVPFLILAATCFSKSSPRAYAWLISHPWYGPPIRKWHEHRVIERHTKVVATVLLICTLGPSTVFFIPRLIPRLVVALIGIGVIVFIWLQRSEPSRPTGPT